MGDDEAMRESAAWIAANIPRRMVEVALPKLMGYVEHDLRHQTVFVQVNVELLCEAHAASRDAARRGGASSRRVVVESVDRGAQVSPWRSG
jgi:hypothetical protein